MAYDLEVLVKITEADGERRMQLVECDMIKEYTGYEYSEDETGFESNNPETAHASMPSKSSQREASQSEKLETFKIPNLFDSDRTIRGLGTFAVPAPGSCSTCTMLHSAIHRTLEVVPLDATQYYNLQDQLNIHVREHEEFENERNQCHLHAEQHDGTFGMRNPYINKNVPKLASADVPAGDHDTFDLFDFDTYEKQNFTTESTAESDGKVLQIPRMPTAPRLRKANPRTIRPNRQSMAKAM